MVQGSQERTKHLSLLAGEAKINTYLRSSGVASPASKGSGSGIDFFPCLIWSTKYMDVIKNLWLNACFVMILISRFLMCLSSFGFVVLISSKWFEVYFQESSVSFQHISTEYQYVKRNISCINFIHKLAANQVKRRKDLLICRSQQFHLFQRLAIFFFIFKVVNGRNYLIKGKNYTFLWCLYQSFLSIYIYIFSRDNLLSGKEIH